MLGSVLIDPSVLWLVEAGDSSLTAGEAIAASLDWMKPNPAGPIKVNLSRSAIGAMANAGAFPAEPRLVAVIQAAGLQGVISPKSLALNTSRFLASQPCVEDDLQLCEAVYNRVQLQPDPTIAIQDDVLRAASIETLALATLHNETSNRTAIYAFPRLDDELRSVRSQVEFGICLYVDKSGREDFQLEKDLSLVRRPSSWPKTLASQHVWSCAKTKEEIEVAIWLSANTLAAQNSCGTRDFRVGTGFIDSLKRAGAHGGGPFSSIVLQKCALTALDTSSLDPKEFRTTANANAPTRQRQRDLALAWRLHVTDSHEGLRMMYWVLPNGSIEFANVENKFAETITEGTQLSKRHW